MVQRNLKNGKEISIELFVRMFIDVMLEKGMNLYHVHRTYYRIPGKRNC